MSRQNASVEPPARHTMCGAPPALAAAVRWTAVMWTAVLVLTSAFAADSTAQARRPAPNLDDPAALQAAVDKAIARGVNYLLVRQLRNGGYSYQEGNYPTGQAALVVYTLLKSGLPVGHPAVRRGLIHMSRARPHRTYAIACHLMALEATHDPAWHPRMKALLSDLLSWQVVNGFGYPRSHSGGTEGPLGRPDLSNTQYAALGLRAATLAGLKVPPAAWSGLIKATLAYQGREKQVEVADKPGMPRTYRKSARGFRYRPDAKSATGSMTAAGVSILAICRKALGRRISRKQDRSSREGVDLGLTWLAHHFSLTENPNHPSWFYYYLYGVERVGSILKLQHLGPHRWYREGAAQLVKTQSGQGGWGKWGEPDTCFALLFLRRATEATVKEARALRFSYAADDLGCGVGLRGFGHWPMRIWISNFDESVIDRFGTEIDGKQQLRVARVEFLVDGAVVGTVAGAPLEGWSGQNYTIHHHFTRAGKQRVTARVHVVRPQAPPGAIEPLVVLKAPGFEAKVDRVFKPWMQAAAEAPLRNRLQERRVTVRTSTQHKPHLGGAKAIDGLESTAWLCRPDDPAPCITLHLAAAVAVRCIVLGQAQTRELRRRQYDPIRRAEIRINGHPPFEVTFPTDMLRPAMIEFPRRTKVRRLSIRILERKASDRGPRPAGFAEIRLLKG